MDKRACVLGASGGIGGAIVEALATSGDFARIYAGSRREVAPRRSHVDRFEFDFADEATLAVAADRIADEGPLDLIVVATGLLHRATSIRPEKSYRELDAAPMAEVFAINTIGPAIAAKHLLPLLHPGRRSVIAFLSARVGSIGDNRLGGWHSYRASKAALNALVRCYSIEMRARNPHAIAVALHPGTVDTGLSMPFRRNVPPEQLFSTEQSAAHLLDVVEGLTPAHSGGFFAWNGDPIIY
ncbi:MAG: SDR family NAD(P)-dependent oxidoreductase [Sphingopyxis sp.]|nr:SDR family NAD(P)-dependent oxidoreductase [Sphingopyxis sp.]